KTNLLFLHNITFTNALAVNYSNLVLLEKKVYLNSSLLKLFNQSAYVTFYGLTTINNKPIVDFEDDGTYQDCSLITSDPSNGVCQIIQDSNGIFIFNVTHFTSYSASGSSSSSTPTSSPSGGGPSSRTYPSTPPAMPTVVSPSPSGQKAARVEKPHKFNLGTFNSTYPPYIPKVKKVSCLKLKESIVYRGKKPEFEDLFKIAPVQITETLPKGYSLAMEPIQLFCKKPKVELTVSVPENFKDLKALRCRNGKCYAVEPKKDSKAECGNILQQKLRVNDFYTPEMFPVRVKTIKINSSTKTQNSSNFILKSLSQSSDVKLSMSYESVKEPLNPTLKLVGTPVVLEGKGKVELKIPKIYPSNIDPKSLEVYVYKNKWYRIESKEEDKYFSVTLTIDGRLLVGLIGTFCENCNSTTFKRVYSPSNARDALILVHGLANTPARFNDIINDIRFTNQPFQVWVFGYPSSRENKQNALDLANYLEKNSANYDRIFFATHSLGGKITQMALRYAYDNNYNFVKKVKKVILVATPNINLTGLKIFESLFDYLVNQPLTDKLFDLDSTALKELLHPEPIERVPGIEYYAIAGTKEYPFTRSLGITKENDGIVEVENVQHVGGINQEPIDDMCKNFWKIPETHTELLDNPISRKIIEQIVAKEITSEDIKLGEQIYATIDLDDCVAGDKILIIGKEIPKEMLFDPTGCSCGNGVCGEGENEQNCPADCLIIPEVKEKCPFWLNYVLLAMLILLIGLVYYSNIEKKYYDQFRNYLFGLVSISGLLLLYILFSCGLSLLYFINLILFVLIIFTSTQNKKDDHDRLLELNNIFYSLHQKFKEKNYSEAIL
ncbi:MAG: hypothetical protein D6734_03730, partial [Candidatus Schekmanbacteria bacterium]